MTRRILVLLAFALAACSGGDDGGGPTGEALANDLGCLACHTAGATDLAPSWNGLFGSTVKLENGSSVTADRDYLQRSIEDPQADIVEGYGRSMPTIPMTDAERSALVDYIESLG
ncbi:MAG: cytochrome c [Acidimicrobiia bacterium]|nr:cytochrome c [Acidimicrobiia bacterium]MDH3462926.1 cytochrome c [Acidimicrobiia bacterium]